MRLWYKDTWVIAANSKMCSAQSTHSTWRTTLESIYRHPTMLTSGWVIATKKDSQFDHSSVEIGIYGCECVLMKTTKDRGLTSTAMRRSTQIRLCVLESGKMRMIWQNGLKFALTLIRLRFG